MTCGLIAVALAVAQLRLPLPEQTIPLQAELDHVQGIDTDGEKLWVSEVQRKQKRGRLHEFELTSGKILRTVDLTRGAQYHPGGIAADETSIWVPVAEYRPKSTSTVLRLSKESLAVIESIPVADHVGAVAVRGEQIIGANWDARQFIDLRSGERRDNPLDSRFQDMKFWNDSLVASGLREAGGTIDWLDPRTLALQNRWIASKTDRGVLFTHEGMAIRGRTLYLLPEDGPSRLFIIHLPEF